jgi:hypothetical protein
LALAGLVGLVRHARAAETPSKLSKEVAKYQDHPNAMQMCGMCRFYTPPSGRAGAGMMGSGMMGGGMMGRGHMGPSMVAAGTCQLVEGKISPMGWCALYQPLQR